jgi:hypothetical protein
MVRKLHVSWGGGGRGGQCYTYYLFATVTGPIRTKLFLSSGFKVSRYIPCYKGVILLLLFIDSENPKTGEHL